jgi:hypothetical protein
VENNEGKSAASVCHQLAAWVQDMFCSFCLVKNHKIVKNSTTTKAREKMFVFSNLTSKKLKIKIKMIFSS